MAKFDCLPASVNRIRRILGRRILNKELPTFVYRFDTRPPQMIRSEGFQPRPNSIGGVSMMEHVNNCYAIGHAHEGRATKYDSQFVSTGAYGMLKPIDSTFAQKLLETNLYKIDTTIALQTGAFYDVNDIFDRAGVKRPYATQREWLKVGGIPSGAVVRTMKGERFESQLSWPGGFAPDENLLEGWEIF